MMTTKTLLAAVAATVALGVSPALAGSDCSYGAHASVPDVVAEADQSTPATTETATSVPFPLPTVEEDTVALAAGTEEATTATE